MSRTPSREKPILVTGASGFIGSVVTRRLIEAGRTVRCMFRVNSQTDRVDNLSIERVIGDLCDADSVLRAAEGCSAIVHVAGISAWSQINSPLMFPIVVNGTRHILHAARFQDVPRVVYVSSAATLGPSRRPEPRDENVQFDERAASGMIYVLAKREAERLCRGAVADNLDVVIVNPAEVYGPDDRDLVTSGNLLALLKTSPVFVCAGGTGVVHVNDVAEGIVRALDRGRSGERYLLSAGNVHNRELAELVITLTGRRSRVFNLPAPVVRSAAAVASRLGLPLPIPAEVIPYATRYWFVDNRKARTELGLEFRSPRETLAETLVWLDQAGYLH